VLYGVGARLDQNPELLFTLRSVNHEELITQAGAAIGLAGKPAAAGPELAESELGAVFGIELDPQSAAPAPAPAVPASAKPRRKKVRKPAPRKRAAKASRRRR
jgi:uncharacterized Zn finger protein